MRHRYTEPFAMLICLLLTESGRGRTDDVCITLPSRSPKVNSPSAYRDSRNAPAFAGAPRSCLERGCVSARIFLPSFREPSSQRILVSRAAWYETGMLIFEPESSGGTLSPLHIPVETETLANGLRVVVSPDHSAPIATVGVYYQIGFRLEPHGRSGFAHLFEHMMFQGSEHAGKMEHIRLINSSGGLLNGSTHYDLTNYYEVVPSNALERVLWLEADRMRALKVDDENLRNQRDVVKEEVRVNVLNQPYGGFPWLDLPPVAFRNWANAHNFYGDFTDLDAATLCDVQAFFKTYYLPNNAVLLMLGDLKPDEGFALARKHYGDIPAGPLPKFADPTEPPQTEERRGHVVEKFGPLPAMAIGYTMPPRRTPDWYAIGLLEQ